MRVAIVCMLLIIPSAAAFLTDPAGDVEVSGFPLALGDPAMSEYADLIALDIVETGGDFTFTLTVGDVPEEATPEEAGTRYEIEFNVGDTRYQLLLARSSIEGLSMADYARWSHYSANGDLVEDRRPTPEVDVDGDTFAATIPREWMRDRQGALPGPSMPLSKFTVASGGLAGTAVCVEVCTGSTYNDTMPDDTTAHFAAVLGVQQTGHAHLSSEQPFRASNGGATTYVFEVVARNNGDDDRFALATTDVPDGWSVFLADDRISLDAGDTAKMPVIVQTPSAHQHGGRSAVVLEMVSQRDPSAVGRVELGVFYADPPQPAGHHDTLYIHSRLTQPPTATEVLERAFGVRGLTAPPHAGMMHTLPEDPLADDIPIDGEGCGFNVMHPDRPAEMYYCWMIPLHGGLTMGLDFDVDGTGTLDISIASEAPLMASQLRADLIHLGPANAGEFSPAARKTTLLANASASPAQDIMPGSAGNFELSLQPHEAADLVPYEQGATLALWMELRTMTLTNSFVGPDVPPTLQTGGSMRLPLLEYADPIEAVLDLEPTITLDVAQEQVVNPGETVLYEATLINGGAEDRRVQLRLSGPDADAARLLAPADVDLAARGRHDFTIAVSAPADAAHGEVLEVVLDVAQDGNTLALARLVAQVDDQVDVPDQAEVARAYVDDKQSPGLPLAWFLLAGWAFVRRR